MSSSGEEEPPAALTVVGLSLFCDDEEADDEEEEGGARRACRKADTRRAYWCSRSRTRHDGGEDEAPAVSLPQPGRPLMAPLSPAVASIPEQGNDFKFMKHNYEKGR